MDLFLNRHREDNDEVGYAYDIVKTGLETLVLLGGSEGTKPEAPARVTGQRQKQGNRIIAANNPIRPTGPPSVLVPGSEKTAPAR